MTTCLVDCFQIFYTILLVVVHILTDIPTNLVKPEDAWKLTPAEITIRIHGSKLVLVTEHAQMCTIWGVKGCLLFMYSRLTYVSPLSSQVALVYAYTRTG